MTINREALTFNLSTTSLRQEVLGGVDYLVAPMVMLTEGVHAGSEGALFYPSDELSKSASLWNHKPLLVHHPKTGGSACEPAVLNSQQVGLILNTIWDGALRAEAWFESNRTARIDSRVQNALNKRQAMELSTGLVLENDNVHGTWKGKQYFGVARNLQPDHLAILPDVVGACSIKDGCGVFNCSCGDKTMLLPPRFQIRNGFIVDLLEEGIGVPIYNFGAENERRKEEIAPNSNGDVEEPLGLPVYDDAKFRI